MQRPNVSDIGLVTGGKERTSIVWDALLSAQLLAGMLIGMSAVWGSLAPSIYWLMLSGAAAWILCAAGRYIHKPMAAAAAYILPWPVLLFFFGFGQARRGFLLWINCVISGWNHLHSGGAALFTVDATAASVMAISVLASAAAGQIIYTVVRRRLFWTCGIFGLVFLCPSLIGGMLSPWACALYFGGFIGVWLTAVGRRPTRQAHRVWVMCMAALCICAVLSSGHELKGITEFRNDAAETLRVLRYGEDTMPQGDLDRAYMLDGGSGTQLRVWTGQEKTLYLRGFVGVDYSGGVWTPLADSAYSEEYSGMLAWLGDRGFDPLEQTSMYYSLCEDEQLPETNRVMIENEGASRYYIYAPGSAGDLSVARYTEKKDQRFSPIGIFGADTYTVDETSSSRPAELTVRADWVEHPQTEEQERYAEAEAVYRGFVYDKYTGVSQNMRELMQDIFWDDYEAENDGIYSAVDHIRSVLKTRVSYTVSQDETPEDSDPIVYFLTGSHRGNAALYASTAVEALRCHGIAARYVEGYYLSASDIAASGDGYAELTGRNIHAWAEVYFDGIGWLPVDVTPGYYFDAVALRQMVALPDTVRKTAALENGDEGADTVTGGEDGSRGLPSVAEAAGSAAMIVMGAAAVLIVLLTLIFLVLELLRVIAEYRARAEYQKASPEEKARLLRRRIFDLLGVWGIDACLGWNTEETDKELARHFDGISAGDYLRTSELLERSIYGGIPLEAYEFRAVRALLEKLTVVEEKPAARQLVYWKLRYSRILPLFKRGKRQRAPRRRKAGSM